MSSVLDSPNPHRLMSLASRINAIHRALTAEELAELLQMSRITILRRAKRGAYSDDVDGRFQRDVNGHSGHVNKVGAQRRWDYNHARHLRD